MRRCNSAWPRRSEQGAAIVALRNSFHIGRIGHWSELCAKHGFASMHYVNVVDNNPIVAMHGAAEPVLSTNPYSAAMPGRDGEALVFLDMATSKIAMGKSRVAYNKGLPVPEGSLLDGAGKPTTDPGCMWPERLGALVAMGEHKGSGLALICELFAGALDRRLDAAAGAPENRRCCQQHAFGDHRSGRSRRRLTRRRRKPKPWSGQRGRPRFGKGSKKS